MYLLLCVLFLFCLGLRFVWEGGGSAEGAVCVEAGARLVCARCV